MTVHHYALGRLPGVALEEIHRDAFKGGAPRERSYPERLHWGAFTCLNGLAAIRCASLNGLVSLLSFLSAVALGLAIQRCALAGEYVIEKGRGVVVCEAYRENLNSLNPPLPLRHEKRVSDKDKRFSTPAWEAVHESKIQANTWQYLWETVVNPVYFFPVNAWPQWKGTDAQMAAARERYWVDRERSAFSPRFLAKVDIDNDGEPDTVYYEPIYGGSYGALLLVLNATLTEIDLARTETILRPVRRVDPTKFFRPVAPGEWTPLAEEGRGYTVLEDAYHHAIYGVFSFAGKTYFDVWWTGHPDFRGKSDVEMGRLRVYLSKKQTLTEVCAYRFVSQNN